MAFDGRKGLMSPGWGKTRDRWLRKHSVCVWRSGPAGEICGERAVAVDHIIPRFEGGPDHESNYQSLCEPHHSTKTAEEGHRAWAAKKAKLERQFDFSDRHPGLL